MAKKEQLLKRIGGRVWDGILYIWNRPVIISGILLVVAAFLFYAIITQTFVKYTNCNYLIVTKLNMDSVFCKGVTVTDPLFGKKLFDMPGLSSAIDKPLEFIRLVIAWSVVVFFAFLSLFLTILINNFVRVVKILTFNKEEWKRFLASARISLLIFIVFCSIFYFSVMR